MLNLTPEERGLFLPDKPYSCMNKLICLLTGKGIITRDEAVEVCYHIPPSEKYSKKGIEYLKSKGLEIPSGIGPDEIDTYEPPETDPTLVGPGVGFK